MSTPDNQDLDTTEPSPGEASAPRTLNEGPDLLAQALHHIHDVASELKLTLLGPNRGNEVSVLSSVISDETKLANLKRFLQEYPDPRHMDRILFCLEQTGRESTTDLHLCISSRNSTRCLAHKNSNNNCVWITRRGAGWVIGSGRL